MKTPDQLDERAYKREVGKMAVKQYNKRISQANYDKYFGGQYYCDMPPTQRPSQGVLDSHDWDKTVEEANPILQRVAGDVVLGGAIVGVMGRDFTPQAKGVEAVNEAINSPNARIGYVTFCLGQNYDRNDTWFTQAFVGANANGESCVDFIVRFVELLHQNTLCWCLYQEEHNGHKWQDAQFTFAFDPLRRKYQARVPVSYQPFGSVMYNTDGLASSPTDNVDWFGEIHESLKKLTAGGELFGTQMSSIRVGSSKAAARAIARALINSGVDVETLSNPEFLNGVASAAMVATRVPVADPLEDLSWVFAVQNQYKAIITAKELSNE